MTHGKHPDQILYYHPKTTGKPYNIIKYMRYWTDYVPFRASKLDHTD